MYVTMAEMIVLMDTLMNAGNIEDSSARVFGFTQATRKGLHKDLLDRLAGITIGVKEDDDGINE